MPDLDAYPTATQVAGADRIIVRQTANDGSVSTRKSTIDTILAAESVTRAAADIANAVAAATAQATANAALPMAGGTVTGTVVLTTIVAPAGVSGGRGPSLSVTASNALTSGAGGAISLTAGSGGGRAGNGGNIVLTPGALTGTGTPGIVMVSATNATLPQAIESTVVLVVAGRDGANAVLEIDGFGGVGGFRGRRANGTRAAPTAVMIDEALANLTAYGYGSTGYSTNGQRSEERRVGKEC